MNTHASQDKLRALLDERMRLGNELLDAAGRRTAAQDALAQAERDYSDAHKAAIAGGWTAAELRKAGLQSIAGPRKKRASGGRATTARPASSEQEPAIPTDQSE